MFPELNLDDFTEEEAKEKTSQGVTYLYDFKKGEFILKDGKLIEATKKEGIKVWIEKILLTEEFVYPIYKTGDQEEYGTTIRKLILGRKVPQLLLQSELKRIISEKLDTHAEIDRIEDFRIKQELATLFIYFTVILKDGTELEMEVNF